MRAFQPELVQQPEHLIEERLEHWPPGEPQRWRLTVPGQVDEDDVSVRCQPLQYRVPGLSAVPGAVQQHQRRTGATALESQPHRTLPTRG